MWNCEFYHRCCIWVLWSKRIPVWVGPHNLAPKGRVWPYHWIPILPSIESCDWLAFYIRKVWGELEQEREAHIWWRSHDGFWWKEFMVKCVGKGQLVKRYSSHMSWSVSGCTWSISVCQHSKLTLTFFLHLTGFLELFFYQYSKVVNLLFDSIKVE